MDFLSDLQIPSPLQPLTLPVFKTAGISVFVKRDDLIHPEIQGNKWRKLKWNLAAAKQLGKTELLTFGGPWSNHVAATAAAARKYGLQSKAFIRGDITPENYTATMHRAVTDGMKLVPVSKIEYERLKNNPGEMTTPVTYVIPEGGANRNGFIGCGEIHEELPDSITHILCPVGSGTTCAGILSALLPHQHIIAFSVFKNAWGVRAMIENHLRENNFPSGSGQQDDALHIESRYAFGGFARVTSELLEFRETFGQETGIDTDLVYTAKMFFGFMRQVADGFYPAGANIALIHTGGIQGNQGFQQDIS